MSPSRVPQTLPADQVRQGAALKTFREIRGLKVGELANALGISYAYLSNIESGRKRLTPQLLAKVAEHLDIPQVALIHPDEYAA